MSVAILAACVAAQAIAADPPIHADKPNAISFPPQTARFVRFVIGATSGGEPCIDELEAYGPDGKRNLALAKHGAKASASSCLAGYAIHQIEHLNDGEYGNDRSWIAASATEGEWAQIELPKPAEVAKVVFSRDRLRHCADRVPTAFEIRLSMDGESWRTLRKVSTTAAPVALRPKESQAGPPILPAPPPPLGTREPAPGGQDLHVPRTDELGFANLALNDHAKPAASSLLPGHDIHQIAHLNDGLAGNSHSWISKADPSWAEIDLGGVFWIYKVAFGSDASGQYSDRAATQFKILAGTEYAKPTEASTWQVVCKQAGGMPVHTRQAFRFKPVRARWVRIAIDAANQNEARIDEIEVYGQADPIPLDKIGPVERTLVAKATGDYDKQIRDAFLGEEHAWLKTYGRADLSSRLVPYNGRVKEYPRHLGDDRLPLPPLSSAPKLDGKLDDACWREASRGVARVAWPYDFETSPCVEHAVTAGWRGDDLYLAIQMDRVLSTHLAVVSRGDWLRCGIVVHTETGLVFDMYRPDRRPERHRISKRRIPLDGAFSKEQRCFEVRLPLSLLPGCRDQGVRIGLGMGGQHTAYHGRSVDFVFSSLAIAEEPPCVGGTFHVRLAVPSAAGAVTMRGNAAGLDEGLTLAPGQSKTIAVTAQRGAIGPEYDLKIQDESGEAYTLKLFRYDPLDRTLRLMREMVDRLEAKGLDVRPEQQQLARLDVQHEKSLSVNKPDRAAERQLFFEARLAKRRLFLREPDLDPIARILFVKRHAFRPSHNYSVLLDSAYRPGGGVCILEVPRRDGRFEPSDARVQCLFEAGGGIARNPMADFNLSKIYFGYRPSADGYYHIMAMNPDGSGTRQLTDGPFHDYWPCPLPDGDLAFISTRCKARYLCWRPQAAVMFRMNADGRNIEPLSYANLTEWAPSVMSDGRIIWTRSEYVDKGADFGHTLWAIRPDGSAPELVFGNGIIQPNGYANGREVPGTSEICCTLISHFGDLNGPIALLDINKGRFNPQAIQSITPEVPWPGMWPMEECFRDPVPLAKDYFLVSHAPRTRFGLFVIDRYGNRELLYTDPDISSMCPTIYRKQTTPPQLAAAEKPQGEYGEMVLLDVYQGISPPVERGQVKYLRVVQEVRSDLEQLPDGGYRKDHVDFIKWYAAPIDKVSGPSGWPSYVAKAPHGLVPIEPDGSARFTVPAGKVLYFQVLDKDLNELQRMRSVVQLRPGERRSCIGCHEGRHLAPPSGHPVMAMRHEPVTPENAPWGGKPFSYEKIVQPVLDARCVSCHNAQHSKKLDFRGTLDADKIPASYRTMITRGLVHYADYGWNSGGCEKAPPLSLGSIKSKLWHVLNAGHNDVVLTRDEMRRIKTWIDLNCPLWPDYVERQKRPGLVAQATSPQ